MACSLIAGPFVCLAGDVYMCAGQSNMQFSLGVNENAKVYVAEAVKYPNIRLFTVGQKTTSNVSLQDLRTIEQNWTSAAKPGAVSDGSFGGHFSAVCYFFGKNVHDKLGGRIPIGLISNNFGGSRVEMWTTPQSTIHCGHNSSGELYNSMIVPFSVGPMALTGFTWCESFLLI